MKGKVMFNESKIAENRCCFNDGRVQQLQDILWKMELDGRKTVSKKQLEEMLIDKMKMYEASWNIYADKNKIGGGRYTCEGKGEKL